MPEPSSPAVDAGSPALNAATSDEQPAQAAETDWKTEARKWEQRAKDNKAKLDEATPIVAQWRQLEEASKSELERKTEELSRWQSEAQSWRSTAVGSRIQALAATDFADPSDAVSSLDVSKYLDAGGQIDDQAIQADLAELLERKPHWRRQEATPASPRIPAPNPNQGSGGGRPAADPAREFASIIQGQLRS